MKTKKIKSAFTMIELVFVIVVLGILASLAMGRMDRDLRQEAAETILSHIRLAQQMALSDNKHLPDNNVNRDKWQTAYWQFVLRPCGGDWSYRVGSDTSLAGGASGLGKTESAINPIDGKYLWAQNCTNLANNESPSVLLTKKFGIDNINLTPSCGNRIIAFDYLGRPHFDTNYDSTPDFRNILTRDCSLTFTLSTDQDNDGNPDNFVITIEKETGHAFIVGQEAL